VIADREKQAKVEHLALPSSWNSTDPEGFLHRVLPADFLRLAANDPVRRQTRAHARARHNARGWKFRLTKFAAGRRSYRKFARRGRVARSHFIYLANRKLVEVRPAARRSVPTPIALTAAPSARLSPSDRTRLELHVARLPQSELINYRAIRPRCRQRR